MSKVKDSDALESLLATLSETMSDEELLLSVIQADISTTIASKRVSLGLSQKDFANALDVSQSQVSKWESGDSNFTLETLVRISLKLGIEMRSPFIPDRLPRYKLSGNIVTIPPARWTSATSGNSAWTHSNNTNQNYELEEM